MHGEKKIQVLHPVTSAPLGVTIDLGDHTRALLDAARAINCTDTTRLSGQRQSTNRLAIEAASKTVNWQGVIWDGEELLFTPGNALMVYEALPWLADQVIEASREDDALIAELCEAVEQATSQKPFEVPVGVGQIYWEWFWEFDQTRGSNGFGLLPISYREIEAWSRLYRIELRPSEVRIIRAMDRIRLISAADQAAKPQGISMHDPQGLAALLRGAGKK